MGMVMLMMCGMLGVLKFEANYGCDADTGGMSQDVCE